LLHAEEFASKDILRFTNGDIIHGNFEGITRSQKITWNRPDIDTPVRFATSQINRLIFNKGKARKQASDTSLVHLINGDTLPAEIISLSESTLEISTDYLGELSIPRSSVSRIAPSPWGGKLIYRGPFQEQGWTIIEPLPEENEEEDTSESEEEKAHPLWVYSSASWYNYSFHPLKADFKLSSTSRIQFDLAWKNRMQLGLALHMDLTPLTPDVEAIGNPLLDKGRSDRIPQQLGSGILCNFHGSNVQLDAIGFDSEIKPARKRIHSENKNFRREFSQTGQAKIDIRTDQINRRILVYINDEIALKWEGKEDQDFLKGSGLAIMGLNTASRLRISNISVSEWNGEPDSALSMTATGKDDIVLLTNGRDRISGQVTEISENIVHVKSSYANFAIPQDQVSEISLSTSQTDVALNRTALIQLQPAGHLKGEVKSTENGRLTFKHSLIGMCDISLPHIALIDFMPDVDLVNLWDEEF